MVIARWENAVRLNRTRARTFITTTSLHVRAGFFLFRDRTHGRTRRERIRRTIITYSPERWRSVFAVIRIRHTFVRFSRCHRRRRPSAKVVDALGPTVIRQRKLFRSGLKRSQFMAGVRLRTYIYIYCCRLCARVWKIYVYTRRVTLLTSLYTPTAPPLSTAFHRRVRRTRHRANIPFARRTATTCILVRFGHFRATSGEIRTDVPSDRTI